MDSQMIEGWYWADELEQEHQDKDFPKWAIDWCEEIYDELNDSLMDEWPVVRTNMYYY